jgi:hypothetical protein
MGQGAREIRSRDFPSLPRRAHALQHKGSSQNRGQQFIGGPVAGRARGEKRARAVFRRVPVASQTGYREISLMR